VEILAFQAIFGDHQLGRNCVCNGHRVYFDVKHSLKNYVTATREHQEKVVAKSYVGFLVQITVLSNARLHTQLHNSYMVQETHVHIHKSFYSQLSTIWEPSNKYQQSVAQVQTQICGQLQNFDMYNAQYIPAIQHIQHVNFI